MGHRNVWAELATVAEFRPLNRRSTPVPGSKARVRLLTILAAPRFKVTQEKAYGVPDA